MEGLGLLDSLPIYFSLRGNSCALLHLLAGHAIRRDVVSCHSCLHHTDVG
jgi:hypothetical protein